MAIVTRIDPIERDIMLTLTGSDAERSAALAAFARSALTEADATNAEAAGYVLPHTTAVDGAASEDLDKVRPDGTIVFEFGLGLQGDTITFIYEQQLLHAPVKTGQFKKSITVYADGVEMDPSSAVPEATDWVFTSTVPYARKIEGGRKKPQSAQAPNGVFEVVAAMAAARFGNIAKVRFTYQNPMGGGTSLDLWAAKHASAMEGHAKQRRQYDKDTRQPAVLVSFR